MEARMKKLILNPILWVFVIVFISVVVLAGCADAPKYTKRDCIIGLQGQVAPGQVLATLFCEKEEPYTPE